MTPAPNSRSVAATTAGISRNMERGLDRFGAVDPLTAGGQNSGGGDLNGTAATPLFGQTGTAGNKLQTPRNLTGNYCGIT